MADRRIVLDANILVRAVLGQRVRGLLEHYAGVAQLLAPDSAFAEVTEHLPTILSKRGLASDDIMSLFAIVRQFVQELPAALYADRESEARTRLFDITGADPRTPSTPTSHDPLRL